MLRLCYQVFKFICVKEMFFAKQKSNQCGLHAIQNVLKTAAINSQDMQKACQTIEKNTGDAIHNHESLSGYWSVSAVLQALRNRDFEVYAAVESRSERTWTGPPLDKLSEDPMFKGLVLHQPIERHFTCIRPETVDGATHLYYVDSQSQGPIRISSRLAMRRCLSKAYSWEPYVIRGEDLEYVEAPITDLPETYIQQRDRIAPPSDFMEEWRSFNETLDS